MSWSFFNSTTRGQLILPNEVLMAKMRLLAHIVAEHQQRNSASNFPKIAENCNYIRLDRAGAMPLIEQLCREGYVTKDNETGLLAPTEKGMSEVGRYLRIVEQKI